MNPHTSNHVPPFADAAHEREWLAQERALQRERLQLDPTDDDARSRSYRLLARVLREPSGATLPADFAQQVAARAAATPLPTTAPESRFEFVLTLALGLVLLVAAGAVIATQGSAWLPAFRAVVPASPALANGWLLALAGCLGASWLLGQWQQTSRP
jgi:hypothetical protein